MGELLRHRGSFPVGWSVRSRCRPDLEELLENLNAELDKLESRTVHRYSMLHHKEFCGRMKSRSILISEIRKAWSSEIERDGDQVLESEVRHWGRNLKVLTMFVVSPIDKLSGDAALL